MINAGDLTARIDLERDVITSVSGAESRVPQTYAQVWARPESLSGHEQQRAQQVAAGVDWRFTIRYAKWGVVRSSDRVVRNGVKYEIVAVLPDEATRDAVVLMCRSINA